MALGAWLRGLQLEGLPRAQSWARGRILHQDACRAAFRGVASVGTATLCARRPLLPLEAWLRGCSKSSNNSSAHQGRAAAAAAGAREGARRWQCQALWPCHSLQCSEMLGLDSAQAKLAANLCIQVLVPRRSVRNSQTGTHQGAAGRRLMRQGARRVSRAGRQPGGAGWQQRCCLRLRESNQVKGCGQERTQSTGTTP